MILKEISGKRPAIGKGNFIAENAVLAGDVTTGEDCSIWYGAVLRGDVGSISLGDRVNVQDGAVMHTTAASSVKIGNDVTVGHGAIIHGAVIGDCVLVGMGAVVMDNAVVPEGTVIAAGAVVLENSVLEPGIYAGVPARKVKDGSDVITGMIRKNAMEYVTCKGWYE
ncbi:MAG: gamma carbonic anhydrase family protein [Bacteroidetes bacterium]|uniref:Gamma carbonic anhydrase family protein n=1 Tax=Candidatus Cryptobacteroides merdigallinarum TaxID=2840770 RepID=A0A9D9HGK1_9BACT|nr:gamma carbonic anhydrase family protein [Candidatus Cryptobacteroides merdigallinarum]